MCCSMYSTGYAQSAKRGRSAPKCVEFRDDMTFVGEITEVRRAFLESDFLVSGESETPSQTGLS